MPRNNLSVAPDTLGPNLQAIVPLCYAIPSFVLDVTLVVIILKSFKSYFYRLFVVVAITVGGS